ncbi:hypothetical protein PENTCL1PPCAC_14880, partial [Pristionchus entomophagus]
KKMDGVNSFYWNLARAFFGVSTVCASLGIICNSLIFITTIRTRALRATYNILIAVCALADVFHQCGTLVQIPFLFGYYLEIESKLCDAILFLPEMGIAIGCTCILCIGLDRMISVLFSIRYRVFNKTYYHLALGSIVIGYCAYLCCLMTTFYRPQRVLCQVMAPYPDEGIVWFASANLLVNVVSTVVYFIMWLGLRSNADSKVMKRIVKSLLIIVTVDVSGWILTPGLVQLSQHLDIEPQQKFAWAYFSIIFVNLALSMKLFIYYFTR